MAIKKTPLTEKQAEVYEAFKSFMTTHDYSPTVKELKEVLNSNKDWKNKSVGAVQSCLLGMKIKGWVKDTNKKSRNLQII